MVYVLEIVLGRGCKVIIVQDSVAVQYNIFLELELV